MDGREGLETNRMSQVQSQSQWCALINSKAREMQFSLDCLLLGTMLLLRLSKQLTLILVHYTSSFDLRM